ncbi:DUF58 domain-containing protein [bacterium AH-315-E10]|nr:DUF58 domain-containing protein [bacterium AH-315-E10]
MPLPDLINANQLSKFRKFELIAHSVVEGVMSGNHKSPYKGFAIEFQEHREYSPGDDLKHLDWKILGKLGRYYIKQYEEDTSMRAYLLLDSSGSMSYTTATYSKLDFGKFICGVLTYLLMLQKDSVGLITFDDDIRNRLPTGSTRQHLKRVLDTLTDCEAGRDTNMGGVLHKLATMLKRRGLIVIISDFFDDIDEITLALNHFAHKRHEIIVFQVLDRQEMEFSFDDMIRFESLENEEVFLIDSLRIKKAYKERLDAHQKQLQKTCHQLRIDFVQVYTDEPFERRIANYLASRLKK